MADPVVHITGGIPDSGTGNITTLGQTVQLQASSTSGVMGPLVQGAVTTSAPTYTTGTTNPLSLDTAGNLRVAFGGTATVSGTVAATQSGTWTVQPGNTANTTAWLVTGTGGTFPVTQATSSNLKAQVDPLTIGSWGLAASTQNVATPTNGQLAMGEFNTTPTTITTGNSSPLQLDANGNLLVNVKTGGAGGGAVFGPTAVGSAAANPPVLIAGTANATATGTVQVAKVSSGGAVTVDGSAVTQPVSGTFWQATQPVSGTVTVNQGTAGSAWPVTLTSTTITGTVAATQSGNWTSRIVGNAGATLDAVIGNATAPTNMLAVGGVFNTTKPTLTTGQSAAFQSNSSGIQLVDGTGGTFPVTGTFWQATQPVSIAATVNTSAAQSGTWTVQQGTPPWTVGGDTASGSADANNPVKIGGVARTSNPTAVTNAQRVNAIFDKLGKQVVVGAIRDMKGVQKTSISATTETTVVTAGAAGVFNDVYAIVVTNKSAVNLFVDFKDATAGTTRMTLAAPASDTRGFTVAVDSAMVQAVAANNWTATLSGTPTSASVEITMLYVSNL